MDMEKIFRVLILFLVVVILLAVTVKLYQYFGLFSDIKKAFYCWAFGC